MTLSCFFHNAYNCGGGILTFMAVCLQGAFKMFRLNSMSSTHQCWLDCHVYLLIFTVFSHGYMFSLRLIKTSHLIRNMLLAYNRSYCKVSNPANGFRQTSSGGGYRPSRSPWRPCRRALVLRRSMSSGAVCSSTEGRRASGEEFLRSKMLEAQLPRGVSSRLTERRFASSFRTREEWDHVLFFPFQANMPSLSAPCRCWRDRKNNMLQIPLPYYHLIWLIWGMWEA